VSKRYILYILLGWVVLFSYRCGTEKNTQVNRFYHNLTAYYNIHFNGQESFNKGIRKYTEAYQYDFTRILPIFIYGNEELSQQIQPQMERTIEKCSKLIRLHSISSKPEELKNKRKLTKEEKAFYNKSEYNKYADDAYLLMGKAYFWQMQYDIASKFMEYSTREFKDDIIRYKAKIWLARCYIELNRFNASGKILSALSEDQDLPSSLKGDFLITAADHFIKQDQYQEAIDRLKQSILHAGVKERKVKYRFILAQLYEATKNHDKAFHQFETVINMNPDYKMEFNAMLKLAQLYNEADRGGEKVKHDLKKMVGNNKNEQYLDQIYYALGKIASNERNLTQAVDFYKQSVASNKENENQKGLSYLAMADIYFQQKKYGNAQAYYDSAVSSLETSYPGYTDLYFTTQNLTELVNNLNIIEREDSLQRIARMEPEKRKQFITRLMEKRKKEEQQNRLTQASRQNLPNRNFQSSNRNGKWYFYSPTALKRGETEFQRRWGKRELKDNWRISSKSGASFGNFANQQQDDNTDENQSEYSQSDREYYTQNLPLTDSAMEASHKKLQEAYFNLGKTYMNDLNNPEKTVESFQKLNEKYPENPFKRSAYYFLYKIFRNSGNTEQSERYKNKILSEFPKSNHAKIITNPDYFRELEQQKNQAEKLYAQTLEAYHNKNYNKVLNNCQKALEKFKNKQYRSRFRYLETLIIGRTQDIISFRDNLQEIAQSYSDTEIGLQANDILAYLKKTELQQINQRFVQNKPGNENQDALSQNPEQEIDQESKPSRIRSLMRYQFEADVPYYFVIIANPKRIDIGRLKFELINFNLDYFLQKDYTTTSDQFNEFYSIITVKKFKDYTTAKKYHDLVKKRENRVFPEFSSKEYRYFYISLKNYLTMLEMKSIIEYINFFKIEVNQQSEQKDKKANNAS